MISSVSGGKALVSTVRLAWARALPRPMPTVAAAVLLAVGLRAAMLALPVLVSALRVGPPLANPWAHWDAVYYVRLATGTTITFPTYYVLCHDPTVTASRIVNFASYSAQAADNDAGQVLAIETVHAVGDQPLPETITDDLRRIWPDIGIDDAFRLPKTLKLPVPTIENGRQLDAVIASVGERFGDRPLYFTGMRTDRGVFFSHQTIGLAHDAALDCYRQLV